MWGSFPGEWNESNITTRVELMEQNGDQACVK